jgi:hypothetical protein
LHYNIDHLEANDAWLRDTVVSRGDMPPAASEPA